MNLTDTSATERLCSALGALIGEKLEIDGIVALPSMLAPLDFMRLQKSFDDAMCHPVFNAWSGFAQNARGHREVRNILTIDPAAVALALDPVVKSILDAYIGPDFALLAAGGCETLVADEDNAAQTSAQAAGKQARGVKLVVFLSDIEAGQFSYVKGSHRQARTTAWSRGAIAHDEHVSLSGPAGSVFLFDSAGTLQQTGHSDTKCKAIIYNYHVPALAIRDQDLDEGRYVPPALNPGFLPELSTDDQRILGIAACERKEHVPQHRHEHSLIANSA